MLKLIIYTVQIKSKSEQQIYEFYRCWKYTKYYRTWKQKSKDRPKHNMASLSDVVFHERQIWALQVFIFRRLIWVAHSVEGCIAMAEGTGAKTYFYGKYASLRYFVGGYDGKVWIRLSEMGPNRRSFQDGEKVQILGSVFQWRVHVSPHG